MAKLSSFTALLLVLSLTSSASAQDGAPVTLRSAVELALRHSPTTATARAGAAEAQAGYEVARAALFPRIHLVGAATWLNDERLSPGGLQLPPTASLYTRELYVGVTARQPLFAGFELDTRRRAAQEAARAAQVGVGAAEDETMLRVGETYYLAVRARDVARVARANLARQQAFLALSQDFFASGKATRLDVLRAEAGVREAEATVLAAREREQVAAVLLAQAVGVDEPLAAAGDLPLTFVEPGGEQALYATAQRENPRLEQAALEIAQSDELVGAARSGYFPELSAQGSGGYRDRDVGGAQAEWTVGLVAAWPLFEGGVTPAEVSRARARAARAAEAHRAARLELRSRLREALGTWRAAVHEARAAQLLVETDRRALEAAEDLYRVGRATTLDVMTAQTELARAEGLSVEAATDYAVARLRVAALTGAIREEIGP